MANPARPTHHYVFGFTVAIALAYAAIALFRHTGPVQRLRRLGGDWAAAVMPRLLGILTFAAGALLLFSGATPAVAERLSWLSAWIPLPVVELSHFFDNVAGVMLLVLARGVERRLDAAYHLTIAMLVTGIVLSLLRALDVEQAIVLAIMLGTFVPNRKYFYRKSSLVEERFSGSWIAAILLVVFASIALGLISYADYHLLSVEEFLRFATQAEESRFLRASAGVLAALLVFAVMRLLRPASPIIVRPTPADYDDVRRIVATYPQAAAQLAFNRDKYFLFNEKRTGFVMYAVHRRSWVALGDPIASAGETADLIRRFIALADGNGGWPAFYKVSSTYLYLYLDHALSVVKLGEEARVALPDFSLEGSSRKNLRRVWRKMIDDGCTFEMVLPENLEPLLPEMRAVSDEWLESKKAREKSFSLGAFSEGYVLNYPCGVVRRNGRIIAFSNLWRSGADEEVEADLMRYTNDAPPGIMRYALVEMMLWAKAQNFRWFNLGMASLSGLSAHSGAPLWNQIAVTVRGYGERFYNFQGIREFKQWFHPDWEPLFLVSVGGATRPIVLAHIASLISGGLQGVVKK